MRKIILHALFFLSLLFRTEAQQNNFGWAIKAGAQFDDVGYSITTDNNNNVCSTGYFEGTVDFDPGSGTNNLTSAGLGDIYIQKLSATGTLLWARKIGSTGFDYAYSITSDNGGNFLICGSFEGTVDFDPGTGVSNLTATSPGHDIFVLKLDLAGNFVWAKAVGGNGEDEAVGITTDYSQNVIVTGYFSNTVDFDPGAGTNSQTSNGLYDNFILKLDPSGNYMWAVTMGGTNYDYSKAVATDADMNIITTGTFGATVDFDPGPNTYYLTSNGGSVYGDIYVQKLDSNGIFTWTQQMGWFGDDIGTSVKVDGAGNVYTTGWFQVTVDFDPGSGVHNLVTNGGGYTDDIFVQKLDANGNFIWAAGMGGPTDDRGFSLALDNIGDVCTTGFHSGTGDFDPGTGTSNLTGDGAFLSKLSNSGSFIWAKQMTASEGHGIASDAIGSIYSTGQFDHSVDFDPGSGTFMLSSNAGSIDAYVQKLNSPSAGIISYIINNTAIHPNPSSGNFNLTFTKMMPQITIEVLTAAGQLIFHTTIENAMSQQLEINQPAGMYFLKLSTGNEFGYHKLIIE